MRRIRSGDHWPAVCVHGSSRLSFGRRTRCLPGEKKEERKKKVERGAEVVGWLTVCSSLESSSSSCVCVCVCVCMLALPSFARQSRAERGGGGGRAGGRAGGRLFLFLLPNLQNMVCMCLQCFERAAHTVVVVVVVVAAVGAGLLLSALECWQW